MLEDEFLQHGAALTRLHNEYKKHGSLCIGFDFDGTIHDFHKRGITYPKMVQLLKDLKSIGCRLVCWTAYPNHEYVIKYLEENNIPFDSINTDGIALPWETRKPFFNATLDDRVGLMQVYYELTTLVNNIKSENESNTSSE